MTSEIAKTLLEFLKLAPRYLIAVGALSAFLLFSSEGLLKRLGVFEFTQGNRAVLGLTLLGSVALFSVYGFAETTAWIRRWWRKRKYHIHVTNRLWALTEDEKQIIRFYVAEGTRANVLRIDDGVVQGLVADGIIHRSASMGNLLEGFAHNISDFAWDYIHLYPNVLEGTTNTYRTDKRMSPW